LVLFIFIIGVEHMGRIINLIETLPIESRKPQWYIKLSEYPIFLRKREFGLASVATLFFVLLTIFGLAYLGQKAQYMVLLSSFVPNVEGRPARVSGAVCKDYPEDAWLRVIDENKVIVALPLSDPEDPGRSFAFMVGSCKREFR
jgi:hypothetical protein